MVKISERLRTAAGLIGEGEAAGGCGNRPRVCTDLSGGTESTSPVRLRWISGRDRWSVPGNTFRMYGMEDYIQTRLSDGVAASKPDEVDTILVAGMGGGLVMHILESGRAICEQAHRAGFASRSAELPKVRRFLMENGYVTEREEMVMEEGKCLPMMRVHFDASAVSSCRQLYRRAGTGMPLWKAAFLQKNPPVLLAYLRWEVQDAAGYFNTVIRSAGDGADCSPD